MNVSIITVFSHFYSSLIEFLPDRPLTKALTTPCAGWNIQFITLSRGWLSYQGMWWLECVGIQDWCGNIITCPSHVYPEVYYAAKIINTTCIIKVLHSSFIFLIFMYIFYLHRNKIAAGPKQHDLTLTW